MEINRIGSYLDNDFILQFIGEKGDLNIRKKIYFF